MEDDKEFEFYVPEGEEATLEEIVGQAIGAASVCWENPAGAGIFDSKRAAIVAQALGQWIKNDWFQAEMLRRARVVYEHRAAASATSLQDKTHPNSEQM